MIHYISFLTKLFFYCMFLATRRLYIKVQETQRFSFKEAFEVKEETHAGFFFLLGS